LCYHGIGIKIRDAEPIIPVIYSISNIYISEITNERLKEVENERTEWERKVETG